MLIVLCLVLPPLYVGVVLGSGFVVGFFVHSLAL